MVEWIKKIVVGSGNVARERSYTNWNTLNVSAIVAEKRRENEDRAVAGEKSRAATTVDAAK